MPVLAHVVHAAGTEAVTEVPTQWGIHEDVYCAVSTHNSSAAIDYDC